MRDQRFTDFLEDKIGNYPYAAKLMDFCLEQSKKKSWDEFSKNKLFNIHIHSGPFTRCQVIFRQKYARQLITTKSNLPIDDLVTHLRNIYGDNATISPQKDGKAIGVRLENTTACDALISWLGQKDGLSSKASDSEAKNPIPADSSLPPLYLHRGNNKFWAEKLKITPVPLESYKQLDLFTGDCFLFVEIEISPNVCFVTEDFIERCFKNNVTIRGIAIRDTGKKVTDRQMEIKSVNLPYPIEKSSGFQPRELSDELRNFIDFLRGANRISSQDCVLFLIRCDFTVTQNYRSFSNWCATNRNYLVARQRELFADKLIENESKFGPSQTAADFQKLIQEKIYKLGSMSGYLDKHEKMLSMPDIVTSQNDVTILIETKISSKNLSKSFEIIKGMRDVTYDRMMSQQGNIQRKKYVQQLIKSLEDKSFHYMTDRQIGKTSITCELISQTRNQEEWTKVLYIADYKEIGKQVKEIYAEQLNEEVIYVENINELKKDSINETNVFVTFSPFQRRDYGDIPLELFDLLIVENVRNRKEILGLGKKTLILHQGNSEEECHIDYSPLSNRIFSPISLLVFKSREDIERGRQSDFGAMHNDIMLATEESVEDSIIEISGFCKIPILVELFDLGYALENPSFDSTAEQDMSKTANLFCMLSLRSFLRCTSFGISILKLPIIQRTGPDAFEPSNASDEEIHKELQILTKLIRKISNFGNEFPELSEFANGQMFSMDSPKRYLDSFKVAHAAHSAILRKGANYLKADNRKAFYKDHFASFLYTVSVAVQLASNSERTNTSKLLRFFSEIPDCSFDELPSLSEMGFIDGFGNLSEGPRGYTEIFYVNQALEKNVRKDYLHDPACGLGIFTLRAIERKSRLLDLDHSDELLEGFKGITGSDSDPKSVYLAKVSLLYWFSGFLNFSLSKEQAVACRWDMEINPWRSDETDNFFLKVAPNFCHEDTFRKFPMSDEAIDFLFCDPPFDDLLEDGSYNHHKFIDSIAQLVNSGSHAVIVLPETFLDSNRDSLIRDKLIEQKLIREIRELPGIKGGGIKLSIAGDGSSFDHQKTRRVASSGHAGERVLLFLDPKKKKDFRASFINGDHCPVPYKELGNIPGNSLGMKIIEQHFKEGTEIALSLHDVCSSIFDAKNKLVRVLEDFSEYVQDVEKNNYPFVTLGEYCEVNYGAAQNNDSIRPELEDASPNFVYQLIFDHAVTFWKKTVAGKVGGPKSAILFFVRPRNTYQLDINYLFLWLTHNTSFNEMMDLGVHQFRIDHPSHPALGHFKRQLMEFPLLLPPASMQKILYKVLSSSHLSSLIGVGNSNKIKPEWAKFLFRYSDN